MSDLTQAEIARLLGKSQQWVSKQRRLAADPMPADLDGVVTWAARRGHAVSAPVQAVADDVPAAISPAIRAAIGDVDLENMDPHELSRQLLIAGVDPQLVRVAVAVANSHQTKKRDAARAGRMVAPEDVIKIVRQHGQLYIEEIDSSAGRQASDLLRTIRERFGVVLQEKNPDAARILENVIRANGNSVIAKVRELIEEQIHGVQALELGA